jgi:hypothetical protein
MTMKASDDPAGMLTFDGGCEHAPALHHYRTLASIEFTSPAIEAAVKAAEQLIYGSIRGLALCSPILADASLTEIASAICHEFAAPLVAAESEAEDRVAVLAKYEAGSVNHDRAKRQLEQVEVRRLRECPRWFSLPSDLLAIRNEMGQPPAHRLATAALADARCAGGLLVIDGLGSERPTGWTMETLSGLAKSAHDAGRPLLVTSDLNPHLLDELGYGGLLAFVRHEGRVLWMASQASGR